MLRFTAWLDEIILHYSAFLFSFHLTTKSSVCIIPEQLSDYQLLFNLIKAAQIEAFKARGEEVVATNGSCQVDDW